MEQKKRLRSPVVLLLGISLLLNAAMGFFLILRTAPPKLTRHALARKAVSSKPKKLPDDGRSSSVLSYDKLPPTVRLNRTNILNALVEKYGYTSYLEIGQGLRTANFEWIRCRIKIGVDPAPSLNAAYRMTSDEFFKINRATFDLIFVDGLHEAGQVERDILNSLEILNANGTILVHDCNPTTKEMQLVERTQGVWTGDVWKARVKLRATRPDLKMVVIDAGSGCGLIRRGRQELIRLPGNLSYEFLDKNRKEWLNLVDGQHFLEDLKRD
jgi:hypothetical protein